MSLKSVVVAIDRADLQSQLDAIRKRIASQEEGRCFDKAGPAPITINRDSLPVLTRFAHAPGWGGISIERRLEHAEDADPWFAWIEQHRDGIEDAFVRYDVQEASKPKKRAHAFECWLTGGWRRNAYRCGLHVGARSPGFQDPAYRADLLKKTLHAWGMEKRVTVTVEGEHIRLVNSEGAACEHKYYDAGPNGVDPLAFDLGPIEGARQFRDAMAESVSRLGKKIHSVHCSIRMLPANYEAMREELSGTGGPWEVEWCGELSTSLHDIIAGDELSEGQGDVAAAALPVMQWFEDDEETFFDVDLADKPGEQVSLRVFSNCDDDDDLATAVENVLGARVT